MQPPLPTKHHAATVTIGLLNGQFRGGRIAGFDPNLADLTLIHETDGGGRTVRQMIPAETVAYLAFHRAVDERTHPGDGISLKVTLVRGESFRVRANVPGRGGVGFFATPDDDSSPFRGYFFYNAGVRTIERAEPLGRMLVERGVVSASQVEQAMAAQVEDRHRPLGEILVEQAKVSPQAVAEVVALQGRRQLRIGELLVEAGLVSDADVGRALEEQQRRRGRRLGEILVAMGVLTEVDLAHTLAMKFHLPFEDLDRYSIDPAAATVLPRSLIEKQKVLPIALDDRTITVAVSDPMPADVLGDVMAHARRTAREVLATPSQIERHVKLLLRSLGDTGTDAFEEILRRIDLDGGHSAPRHGASARQAEAAAQELDDAVARLVHQLLLDAYRRGASDVHVELDGTWQPAQVRLRVDGECVPYHEVPGVLGPPVVARLKAMAGLDAAERLRPQEGRLKVQAHDRVVEFRVASVPTANGDEDVALRTLADLKPVALDAAGLSPTNLLALKELLASHSGLILCAGPRGAGVTTTLHAMLGAVNNPGAKVWTVEDPIELTQRGARQVQVNRRLGATFASTLRTVTRANPDAILVGEMADAETAALALDASQADHLVLSALQARGAPEAIARLLAMGLAPYGVSTALQGVLAQRLVRGLCTSCRASRPGTREEWSRYAQAWGDEGFEARHPFGSSFAVWHAPGCQSCEGTGHRGRVAIHELLVCDDTVRHAIRRESPVDDLRDFAVRSGMTSLVQDGIEKALAGRTDFAQVVALTLR